MEKYLGFHSSIRTLKYAPPSYISPHVDVLATLGKTKERVVKGSYASQFDFDWDLGRLISKANDGHLTLSLCFQRIMHFEHALPLVSVSADGLELPRIFTLGHRSACFLPWHRNILSVIEAMLRDRCAYHGSMPYWDWSLDWMDLANSSIWDGRTGFGGDGDPNGPETVGQGRCVVDGPFIELRPVMYNHTPTVHCLSRGFRDGAAKGRLPGEKFSPENIGTILRLGNYADFLQRLERDLHNTLHTSINGDFKAMTAANGEIFSPSHFPVVPLSILFLMIPVRLVRD
ncbi:tyrosinase [Metarhizium rileyi]|uniref:Tyrosinase n=1 Tax=Metarhizium rileyi (strain RCEF 4871) TaxID=1649241 RepID=A0A167AGU9_METRR|nr:tyrosinase [Metarhizium rileyi RCEF 4871]